MANSSRPRSSGMKQRSILDFVNQGLTGKQTVHKETEVIDLTFEEDIANKDDRAYKESNPKRKEEVTEAADAIENKQAVGQIECPLCNDDLKVLEMDLRITHVEKCLQVQFLNDKAVEKTSAPKYKRKNDENKPKKESPYRNKKVKTEEKRTGKLPKVLKRESTRPEIPNEKILRFESSTNKDHCIAVDAFKYGPHEQVGQYFLSHFHSDHYGGLSRRWCYEMVEEGMPIKLIFCSEITARLLQLCLSIEEKFIVPLAVDKRYLVCSYDENESSTFVQESSLTNYGLYVTPVSANHCPGAVIFLFESFSHEGRARRVVHCGDFRVNKRIIEHPALLPFRIDRGGGLSLDEVYLDTTYLSSLYNFPKQEVVCEAISDMLYDLSSESEPKLKSLMSKWFGCGKQVRITDFAGNGLSSKKKKFLVLVGTYLIGKEKLAMAILGRLHDCPIFVLCISGRGDKYRILRTYGDEYLNKVLSDDDTGGIGHTCVIHLVPMKIVSSIDELSKYFNHNRYFEIFERCIGLRPTGWSFVESSNSYSEEDEEEKIEPCEATGSTLVLNNFSQTCSDLINMMKRDTPYTYPKNILPQASLISGGSRKKQDKSLYRTYSLPYSEHSSYRELSFFVIFFNINKVTPTVNTGNHYSRIRLASIINIWERIRQYKLGKTDESSINRSVLQSILDLNIDDF